MRPPTPRLTSPPIDRRFDAGGSQRVAHDTRRGHDEHAVPVW